MGLALTFLSVAMIKYSKEKHLREEKLFGIQLIHIPLLHGSHSRGSGQLVISQPQSRAGKEQLTQERRMRVYLLVVLSLTPPLSLSSRPFV